MKVKGYFDKARCCLIKPEQNCYVFGCLLKYEIKNCHFRHGFLIFHQKWVIDLITDR